MSLIHWWPLNGDTKDYGVENITLTNNGNAEISNNGKIGKTYNLVSGKYLNASTTEFSSQNSISISYWLKLNENSSTAWLDIFNIGIFRAEIYNNNQMWTGYSDQVGSISGTTVTLNTWIHYTHVYDADNHTYALYKDGKLVNKVNTTTYTVTSNSILFAQGALNINLNDIRIYDHILSIKEIKEISKGLMLHYNFENYYQTSSRNVYAGTAIMKGNFPSTSSFAKSGPFIDETGDTYYTYKLNYTGTGSNFWPMIRGTHFAFTIDKRYYYSCDIRIRNANFNIYLRAAKYDNDWVAASVGAISSSESDNTWRRKEVSTIIPETFVRSGETLTSNPQLEFCSDSLSESGKVYTCEFDIKNVQVVESDYSVPFVDGSAENIISDNSGYRYNSTITGNVTLSNNTATGNYSAYSPSGANYVQRQDNTFLCFNSTQIFTINTWIKINSYVGTDWNTIFRLASTNTTDQQLHWCYKSTGQIILSQYGDDKYYNFNITGQWCMLTWTHYKDGNIAKCKFYVNGVQVGNEQSYSGLLNIQSNPRLTLFYDSLRSAYGSDLYMSDFKIYATALSASDILAEYNRKASIDRNGNLFTGEVIEENTNVSTTRKNQVKTYSFNEGSNTAKFFGGYTELEYIESTGTQYIDTGFIPKSSTLVEATLYTNETGNKNWFGSNSSSTAYVFNSMSSSSVEYSFGNSNWVTVSASNVVGTKFNVVYSINGIFINGTKLNATLPQSSFTSTLSLCIFVRSGGSGKISGKLYTFKIYDNGSLVRDFIPAKRNKDNVIGLYDLVEHKFYTNQGTGTFTVGAELGPLSAISINEINEV